MPLVGQAGYGVGQHADPAFQEAAVDRGGAHQLIRRPLHGDGDLVGQRGVRPPSVALIVKLNVPALVGFPVMAVLVPDEADMVRPGGRLPAVTAKVTVPLTVPVLLTATVVE